MRRFAAGVLWLALGTLLAVAVTEATFFALVAFRLFRPNVDGWYALSGNVRFHPMSGYVHTGDARYVRISGTVEADHVYRLAHGDYFSRVQAGLATPPQPGQKRIVVFGDSFTDSTLYLQRSWVEQSEAALRSVGHDLVLLPYAFAGNGLAAWHSVYQGWLRTREQFDMVVFAGIYEDYGRPLMIAQGTSSRIHMQRLPISALATLASGRPPETIYGCGGVEVVSPATLEWLVRTARGEVAPGFNAVRYLALHARRLFFRAYSESDCVGSLLTESELTRLLDDILADLSARGTKIVFALVPERDALIAYLEDRAPAPGAAWVEAVAARAHAAVFSGYAAFKAAYERRPDRAVTPEAFVKALWLKYDAHWGQAGSDLFGDLFASFLAPVAGVAGPIGVFRDGSWFLDLDGNGRWDGCGVDGCLTFGATGDVPVGGAWTGLGLRKVGVFRDAFWFLDLDGNGRWDGCATDACLNFGRPGDVPVVGDWTGTGQTRIGVRRGSFWFLDLNGDGKWDGCGVDGCFAFGTPGDVAVVGDWTGTGRWRIGVFRDGQWFLDLNGNGLWDGCSVDACVSFGAPGDVPVAADWRGTGQTNIGVIRGGTWFLDVNGNRRWEGCRVDACSSFGLPTDRPVGAGTSAPDPRRRPR